MQTSCSTTIRKLLLSIYENFWQKSMKCNRYCTTNRKENIFVDLNKTEGLPSIEQMPNEEYNVNDRIKVYITDVKKTTKGSNYSITYSSIVKDYLNWKYLKFARRRNYKNTRSWLRTKIVVYAPDERIDCGAR